MCPCTDYVPKSCPEISKNSQVSTKCRMWDVVSSDDCVCMVLVLDSFDRYTYWTTVVLSTFTEMPLYIKYTNICSFVWSVVIPFSHSNPFPSVFYITHIKNKRWLSIQSKNRQIYARFFQGELHPYIFHMSWTANKDNKLLYFKQMGEWYLEDVCVQEKVEEILPSSSFFGGSDGDLVSTCCHAEPLISCHYRDKPSVIPCHDSPPIDKGKPSCGEHEQNEPCEVFLVELHNFVDSIFEVFGTQTTNELLSVVDLHFVQCLILRVECSAAEVNRSVY
jgi:hypothetical protein